MVLTGFLNFDYPLECLGEVLGKTLPVTIGGVAATMGFPRLSEKSIIDKKETNDFFCPLEAPIGAEGWKRGERPLFWGQPISFPDITVSISQVAFFVECTEIDIDSVAHSLYEDMPRWKDSFINYCELKNKCYPRRPMDVIKKKCDFDLYSDVHIQNNITDIINIYMSKSSDSISFTQIMDACKFASSGKEILIEYQMILAAYEGIEKKQNRLAIINASSALEICLINQIETFCKSIGLDSGILLSGYKSLGDRVKLVQKLFPSFSNITEINEKVIKIRNNVAHNKTIFPTYSETDELLKKVEECLKLFYNDFYEV